MLARLQRAQAMLTAINAAVLSAFTAQGGYEPDGHRSARAWLINRTGMSKGAAGGAVGWQKRLARHGKIAETMAAGGISESWAREIAAWTDKLPADKRDEADAILLDAAAGGLPLEDLAVLARTIAETWQAQHPDPDDGNGDTGMRTGSGTGTCGSAPRSAGPGSGRGPHRRLYGGAAGGRDSADTAR
jgi:hypothetical protein